MASEKNKDIKDEKSVKSSEIKNSDTNTSFFDLRTKQGQVLFFLITVTICCLIQTLPINLWKNSLTNFNQNKQCNFTCPTFEESTKLEKRPTYWVYGRNSEGGHLKHIHLVLQRLGFQRGTNSSDWDLLWSHDYPFRLLNAQMHNLRTHQRVNHFPGCGFITNKVDLATTDLKYIPKSFKLPENKDKLLEYAKKSPEKLFVQKHNQHRHIQIKNLDEIDLTNNDTFVQEFVTNPLLVDGHKFDIGVYVIITSIDPLRVYMYHGDILFRYCPVKYHPLDPLNVDKYIVGDDYLPSWEVPSLAPFYNGLGFGMKGSFDAYLRSKGRDPSVIWKQVEDAIRIAIVAKEPHITKILQRFRNKRNFFELMRFDLVVDDDLKVFLMEANMSPNLSSAHFPPNQLLYEQVLYHMMSLVGVGSLVQRESLRKRALTTESMLSTDKNIVVDAVKCSEIPCNESCAPIECRLCKPCLGHSDLEELHAAYREHINRGETKRIFPISFDQTSELDEDYLKDLSANNQFMTKWFYKKCQMDSMWCS